MQNEELKGYIRVTPEEFAPEEVAPEDIVPGAVAPEEEVTEHAPQEEVVETGPQIYSGDFHLGEFFHLKGISFQVENVAPKFLVLRVTGRRGPKISKRAKRALKKERKLANRV